MNYYFKHHTYNNSLKQTYMNYVCRSRNKNQEPDIFSKHFFCSQTIRVVALTLGVKPLHNKTKVPTYIFNLEGAGLRHRQTGYLRQHLKEEGAA